MTATPDIHTIPGPTQCVMHWGMHFKLSLYIPESRQSLTDPVFFLEIRYQQLIPLYSYPNVILLIPRKDNSFNIKRLLEVPILVHSQIQDLTYKCYFLPGCCLEITFLHDFVLKSKHNAWALNVLNKMFQSLNIWDPLSNSFWSNRSEVIVHKLFLDVYPHSYIKKYIVTSESAKFSFHEVSINNERLLSISLTPWLNSIHSKVPL